MPLRRLHRAAAASVALLRPISSSVGCVRLCSDAVASAATTTIKLNTDTQAQNDVSAPKSRLARMLAHNASFVTARASAMGSASSTTPPQPPRERVVVISCMDARLVDLLPKALNIVDGDAKVIKTAGAILTHPFGGVMRSVIVAVHALKCKEVFVVAHHDCGMLGLDADALVERMHVEGGVPRETVRTLEAAGVNVHGWLKGFSSVRAAVQNSVSMVRQHPLIPRRMPVHGLIIDPRTGALDLVVDGNIDASREAPTNLASVQFGVQ